MNYDIRLSQEALNTLVEYSQNDQSYESFTNSSITTEDDSSVVIERVKERMVHMETNNTKMASTDDIPKITQDHKAIYIHNEVLTIDLPIIMCSQSDDMVTLHKVLATLNLAHILNVKEIKIIPYDVGEDIRTVYEIILPITGVLDRLKNNHNIKIVTEITSLQSFNGLLFAYLCDEIVVFHPASLYALIDAYPYEEIKIFSNDVINYLKKLQLFTLEEIDQIKKFKLVALSGSELIKRNKKFRYLKTDWSNKT